MTTQKIWASLDDFILPTEGRGLVGRSMANAFFFQALMEHSSYDQFHFFLANSAHQRLFVEANSAVIDRFHRKVQLFNRVDLAEQLAGTDYHVFHQSDHVHRFNELCRVRNRLGAKFPVTARIHSISYGEYMGKYLEMAHTGVTAHDAIFCSSASGKRALANCFQRVKHCAGRQPPVRLIDMPLGIGADRPALDRQDARARLGITSQVTALAFGRFSDFDKMDLFPLLQAMRRAWESGRPWRLIMAGAANSPEYLRMVELWVRAQGLEQAVTVMADPDEAAKAALFAGADFFVSVADNPQETFGLTVLEAMAHGLPILASDLDGYRDTTTADCAILVPTSWSDFDGLARIHPAMDELTFHRYMAQALEVDVAKLAAGLSLLFHDSGLRQRMGQAARQRFEEEFSHGPLIRRMETTWRDLAASFTPADREDPLNMEIFSSFGHYVTGFLAEDTFLRATSFAGEITALGSSYPLFSGMNEIIDASLVPAIINACGDGMQVKQLEHALGIASWRVRYTLLWMLKHELLERDDR